MYAEIINNLKAKKVTSIFVSDDNGTEHGDVYFEDYLTANFRCDFLCRGGFRAYICEPLSIEERLKEMTYEEASDLFLTDENLHDEADYGGWIFDSDNHTGAVYFYDEASLLSLYCAPSFEGDWGKMVFCLSSEYPFADSDNTRVIEEVSVLDMAGDIEGQRTKWRDIAHAIIDDIKILVKEYDEFVLRAKIDSGLYGIGNVLNANHDAYVRINYLKECLFQELNKIK